MYHTGCHVTFHIHSTLAIREFDTLFSLFMYSWWSHSTNVLFSGNFTHMYIISYFPQWDKITLTPRKTDTPNFWCGSWRVVMSSHMFCVHIGFEFSSLQAYCHVKVQVMIGSLTPAHPATPKYLEFYIQSSRSNWCIKYHNTILSIIYSWRCWGFWSHAPVHRNARVGGWRQMP